MLTSLFPVFFFTLITFITCEWLQETHFYLPLCLGEFRKTLFIKVGTCIQEQFFSIFFSFSPIGYYYTETSPNEYVYDTWNNYNCSGDASITATSFAELDSCRNNTVNLDTIALSVTEDEIYFTNWEKQSFGMHLKVSKYSDSLCNDLMHVSVYVENEVDDVYDCYTDCVFSNGGYLVTECGTLYKFDLNKTLDGSSEGGEGGSSYLIVMALVVFVVSFLLF